jgi:hypothetical protein
MQGNIMQCNVIKYNVLWYSKSEHGFGIMQCNIVDYTRLPYRISNVYKCLCMFLFGNWNVLGVTVVTTPQWWRQVQLLPWRSIAAAGVPGTSSPQFSKAVAYPGEAAAHRRWLWWLGEIIQRGKPGGSEVTLGQSQCWKVTPATYPAISSRMLRLRQWLNVPAPAIYAVVTSSCIGDPKIGMVPILLMQRSADFPVRSVLVLIVINYPSQSSHLMSCNVMSWNALQCDVMQDTPLP